MKFYLCISLCNPPTYVKRTDTCSAPEGRLPRALSQFHGTQTERTETESKEISGLPICAARRTQSSNYYLYPLASRG